jgi:beta-aspartyl-peptidase (threonine type)
MNGDRERIRIALHGGAGDAPRDGDYRAHRDALARIVHAAWRQLQDGADALDVAESAVAALEDCPLFNAGTGAVLNADGAAELDAAVMRGSDRACGAVAAVTRLRNPVRAARAVMAHSPHVLLAGAGAERFAESRGLALIDPKELIVPERARQLAAAQSAGETRLDHDRGTVGAVARDALGHLAAATSTGGMTNKLPGRVGDAPVIGAGTFADDRSAAISCTGAGEAFIRAGFGHCVHAQLVRGETGLAQACSAALAEVSRYGGRGGCIAIDRHGSMALPYTTGAMFRAWCDGTGTVAVAIFDE